MVLASTGMEAPVKEYPPVQLERSREKKARNKKQGVKAKERMGLLAIGLCMLFLLFTAVKGG